MLVKIISCKDNSYWYKNLVGTIIPIHKVTFNATEGMLYWAREGGTWNAINFIKPSDTEVVESEDKYNDFVFAESFEEITKGSISE